MHTLKVIYTGRVQGVGFRYTIKELAMGFDVVGWISNLLDGTVELVVSGEAEEVNAFLEEIVQESDVAHHIKQTFTEALENFTYPLKGFIIK